MRLLVCGGRDFNNRAALKAAMNSAVGLERDVTIIHGGARGADQMAGEIALAANVPVLVFPADWSTHGKRAGPLRNQLMLDAGKPDLVLAAPGGAGTADMVKRAKKYGLRVLTVKPGDPAAE